MDTFTFEQVVTFVLILIALLGLVVLLSNVVNSVEKLKGKHDEPVDKLVKRVDGIQTDVNGLQDRMETVEKKLDGDWEFRQDELEFNRVVLHSMRQILKALDKLSDEAVDKDTLEEVDEEIDTYLINHQK